MRIIPETDVERHYLNSDEVATVLEGKCSPVVLRLIFEQLTCLPRHGLIIGATK